MGTKPFKISYQFRSIRAKDLFVIARSKLFKDANMGKIDALYTPYQTLTGFNAAYFYEMPT